MREFPHNPIKQRIRIPPIRICEHCGNSDFMGQTADPESESPEVQKRFEIRLRTGIVTALVSLSFQGRFSISRTHHRSSSANFKSKYTELSKKSWYAVARNFFLLLLNFSAWPGLGAA